MRKKEYALYKGNECLGIGTIKELAQKFNVKEKTISFYSSPAYLKRREKSRLNNYKVAVKIESDIDE